ncbi:MAG: alpha/beta hydrolase [Clostridiales bacterium]|nr:alpha/beta hydrolase [Clostridiales bacterium]
MVKLEFYYPSSDGKTQIHAIRWEPEGKPKAIVQIIHGMVEFIDRYDEFARFLVEHDYLVCGEDHLGHGASVISDEYHGFFGKHGNDWVISDIHELRNIMQKEYPDLPYLMLGHSMGSFLLRQYITEKDAEYAKGLSGVVVMGTGWQPNAVLNAGKLVAMMLGTNKVGKKAKLIDGMSFGSYLKRIKNPRTVSDWLTKDNDIVDKYRQSPWCTFSFTPNAYFHMFNGMLKAHDTKRMQKLPKDMPLLLTSGAEDPVGNWGEGVRKAYMAYLENSPCKVDIRLYEDDRHEILNETDREDVFKDLRAFFDNCLKGYEETYGVLPVEY